MPTTFRGHKVYTVDDLLDQLELTDKEKSEFEEGYQKFVAKLKAQEIKKLARRVKSARTAANVTQTELARRLRTTRSAISRIEKGEQNLTIEYMVKIASALGKNVDIRIY